MKKIAALLMCVVLLTGFVACNKSKPDTEGPINYKLSEFDGELISYLCLNGYDDSDFMVSPTALRVALCLAASSAQSDTRAELVKAAGFSDIDSLNKWYSRMKNAKPSFSVANSLWSNTDLMGGFTDIYTSSIKETYDADAYSYNPDEMLPAINEWIDQKTDGMITTAANDAVGASAIFINTIHLKTAWENAFSKFSTYENTFVGIDGQEQTMNFMENTGEFLYCNEAGTKVLVLPMKDNMSFVCFLGNRTDMFDKMTKIHMEKVHVVLPKFDLESTFNSNDLLGFLLSRGVKDAINENSANFYNMCTDANWFIQEIIQKTRITIDEKGIGSAPKNKKAKAGEPKESAGVNEFIADSSFSFAVFSDFGTNSQHMLLYGQLMKGN
ncbi:MAG: hypothetical protein J1E05_04535 [Eubacterium sp.]|nr:hypothetical protein [Eubacterium sp.]